MCKKCYNVVFDNAFLSLYILYSFIYHRYPNSIKISYSLSHRINCILSTYMELYERRTTTGKIFKALFSNMFQCTTDEASYTFSEFGPRQTLDRRKMPFGTPLGQILSIPMCMLIFIKIFLMTQVISSFHKLIWHGHTTTQTDSACTNKLITGSKLKN